MAHNLVWEVFNGSEPTSIIDHIDGNPFNNNICNLRLCDSSTNQRNVGISSRNKTGVCLTSAGNGKYVYYEAYVVTLDGKLLRKKFSTLPDKAAAFKSAVEWRESQILLLNAIGAGYTDRHGK